MARSIDAEPKQEIGVTQIYDIMELKEFGPDNLIRKKMFKTEQLWAEIACYEPGQATIMHKHPLEEEIIYVVEGVANMNIEGDEVQFGAGALAKFPANVMHDVRNEQEDQRLVIMFIKSPRKLERKKVEKNG